jgi:hypothetical protein
MKRKSGTRTWPLIILLMGLFILSLLAPREWRSVAVSPVAKRYRGTGPGTSASPPLLVARQGGADRPGRVSTAAPGRTAEAAQGVSRELRGDLLSSQNVRPLIAEQQELAAAAAPSGDSLAGLRVLETPRRVLEIAPPVARQYLPTGLLADIALPAPEIEVDPSVPVPRSLPRPAEVADNTPQSPENVPNLDRRESRSVADVVTRWPYPTEVARRIQALAKRPVYAAWAADLLAEFERLHALDALMAGEVSARLGRLRVTAQQAAKYATAETDLNVRVALQRVSYGLSRRLAIWEQVSAIAGQSRTAATKPRDAAALPELLAAAGRRLQTVANGETWREYLLLDEAQRYFARTRQTETTECQTLAKRMLLRMDFASLTPAEAAFLQQPDLAALAAELKHLATEPVDYLRLLDEIEHYESERGADHAIHTAAAQQTLRWSPHPAVVDLSRKLDAYYRNANVRVAVSKLFIERMLPPPERTSAEVNDMIMGARTVGYSEALTRLKIRLIPNPRTWRIGLEADGEVASETYSSKGAATFYNTGNSVFRAQKEVVVDPNGVRHGPAAAAATAETSLSGLATTLDPLPILGDIAQNIARRQYEQKSEAARWEMENRIAWETEQRFNAAVEERLQIARQQFANQFYNPMRKLALNPVALDMQTTDERLVARYRLAGYHQLGAHTPRPQAPTHSVLSVQIHESALNNFTEQLRWAGREANMRDLHRELGELFQRKNGTLPEDFPDDVAVTFAKSDPIRIGFQEGRVSLTLSFKELSQGKNRWRDFTVRVYYRPAPEQPGADLVRDQYVELMGKRLHFRDQVALRGVFSRIFARNQPVDFVSRMLQSDRRLTGLAVTQIAIDDGWLGIAIGSAPMEARRKPNAVRG